MKRATSFSLPPLSFEESTQRHMIETHSGVEQVFYDQTGSLFEKQSAIANLSPQHIPSTQVVFKTSEHIPQTLEDSSLVGKQFDIGELSENEPNEPHPCQDDWTEDIVTICSEDVVFSYNFEERAPDDKLNFKAFCPVQVTIRCLSAFEVEGQLIDPIRLEDFAPDSHSRVETHSQLVQEHVCAALQFSTSVSGFLSVRDLCAFSTTSLSGFVRLQSIVLLKRHLILAGTELLDIPVSPIVALTFDLSSCESNYICLGCSSSFIMLSPAMRCFCQFSDLPDLLPTASSSVPLNDGEDNVAFHSKRERLSLSASCVPFNSNCPLGLPCDPVSIPVPCDDDDFDKLKPDEIINVKWSNETFATAYPPIFYELAPETCALSLLSAVDVSVIASTCVVSHDCWRETARLRRHLDLTRGWLGDYFFSSRVQLSFLPNQQESV